jgi:hypothetical protein
VRFWTAILRFEDAGVASGDNNPIPTYRYCPYERPPASILSYAGSLCCNEEVVEHIISFRLHLDRGTTSITLIIIPIRLGF